MSDSFGKIDVLMVDDRPENLLALEAVLASPDYHLIRAHSGDEALRYLLDHTPALILMDVQMPELNGFETATLIKRSARTREIPIIFITALGKDEGYVHQGYDTGAVDYIYKPYDGRVLKAKVAVFAEIHRQHRRVSRMIAVQQATTRALAESVGVNQAISAVLKSTCLSLGWDAGLYWKVNKQKRVLECNAQWYDPRFAPGGFLGGSLKKQYAPGLGFPGKVWSSHAAIWENNLTGDGRFEGLSTALGCPIFLQEDTLGVIELVSRKTLVEDPGLVKVMGSIGGQIGQVLKRAEAYEILRTSEGRLAFLAEAGVALSASLNYEETLSTLAKLSVKHLAEWCSIDVLEDGRSASTVSVSHLDASRLEPEHTLEREYALDWSRSTRVAEVIRTGTSELHRDFSSELLAQYTQDSLPLLRQAGPKAALLVPLIARGKTLGAMTLVSGDASRAYTSDDLMLAEELARRAAVAIDNAKLYREAQDAIVARDEFFSIASHELKTPITSLKLLLQITQRNLKPEEGKVPTPQKLSKMLQTSNRQVDQLTHLVEDLLNVVQIRAGKLILTHDTFNLSELVKEVAERYSESLTSAKCELRLDVEPQITGSWDRNRIEQVMVNLISNVIKYAPGTPLEIHLSRYGEGARLMVRDFGPGIPRDRQAKVFERFERAVSSRSISGLGLGLFIAKQIIEAHHGMISIESHEGSGTAFYIDLPVTDSVPIAAEPGLRHAQPERHTEAVGKGGGV